MIQQILSQFANKEDVMRRFSQLSKKIREILDLLNRGGGDVEDNGMFTRRQIGPVACASCEKNIVNLQQQPADFYAWKKMPFRDPSERIARYGPGFSKVLANMRPSDMLSHSPTNRKTLNQNLGSLSIDDTGFYYNGGNQSSRDSLKKELIAHNTGNDFYPKSAKKIQPIEQIRKSKSRFMPHLASSTDPGSSIGAALMGDTPDFSNMQSFNRPDGIVTLDETLPALKPVHK